MLIWEEGQPDGKTRLHSASLATVLSLQPSNASLLASHHCPARLQAKDRRLLKVCNQPCPLRAILVMLSKSFAGYLKDLLVYELYTFPHEIVSVYSSYNSLNRIIICLFENVYPRRRMISAAAANCSWSLTPVMSSGSSRAKASTFSPLFLMIVRVSGR